MAQREPKSRSSTTVTIVGRDGSAKGIFEITSGNFTYSRAGAKSISGQWTLQQLVEVLERDLSEHLPLPKRISLTRLAKGDDFTLFVTDIDGSRTGDTQHIISQSLPLKKFDQDRKLEHGAFQIDDPRRKPSFGFTWSARISVITALYVLDLYIRKWLMRKPRVASTNPNVPISKAQMAAFLRQWLTDVRA